MTDSKEDAAKSAEENWQLAHEWDKAGKPKEADEARRRAIENEKARDSWLYRFLGW